MTFDITASMPLPVSVWRGISFTTTLRKPGVLLELEGAAAVEALHQDLHVAVGQLQALDDVADGAEGVDLVGARVVPGGVVLGGEEDALPLHQRVLEGLDGAGPPDDERDHHVGEDHDVPQRHHGQGLDHVGSFLVSPEHGPSGIPDPCLVIARPPA